MGGDVRAVPSINQVLLWQAVKIVRRGLCQWQHPRGLYWLWSDRYCSMSYLNFSKLLYVFSCRLNVCSVPGCFLEDLSNPASKYVKYFKKSKEELTQKLYALYNSTIFEQKVGFTNKRTQTQSNLHFYSYKNLVNTLLLTFLMFLPLYFLQ